MSRLYDRADIYDLIDSDQRTEMIRRDWKEFLNERDIHTMLDVSIGTGSMKLAEDSSGRPVFYAMDLNANYFESFSGVEVKANSVRSVHVPISYGILQRVRDGVLIDSY